MSEAKITMKLLVDKSKNRVLFGEGRKECVDFFLHILSLSLGTVVGFLTKESMVGSLGSLYGSLENIETDYMQEGVNKESLLNPKPATSSTSNVPLLTINPSPDLHPATNTFYTCSQIYDYGNSHMYVSETSGGICRSCNRQMTAELTRVIPPAVEAKVGSGGGGGGYVKGVVTYMIMDDLSVEPMSTISGITLLNKFNVQDVGSLEEKLVTLDMKQAVALLKASLTSKTVLTDVFLGKK